MANVKQLPPVNLDVAEADKDSVLWAIEHGTRLDRLKAIRRRIGAQIDDPHILARDLAALTRRLAEVDKDIDEMETVAAELELEEVAFDAKAGDIPFDPATA